MQFQVKLAENRALEQRYTQLFQHYEELHGMLASTLVGLDQTTQMHHELTSKLEVLKNARDNAIKEHEAKLKARKEYERLETLVKEHHKRLRHLKRRCPSERSLLRS